MFISLDRAIRLVYLIEQVEKSLGAEIQLDTIKMAQSSLLFNLGAMNPNLMKAGLTDMVKYLGSFKTKITDIVMKFKNGEITREQALEKWDNLSGEYYTNIFKAGTKAAGNPYYAKMGLNDKDTGFIDQAKQDETPYFEGFLDDIKNNRGVIDYGRRASFYADTAKAQFFNGMLAGHGNNVGIKWVLDEFAEHCDDCISLSASTYTWETLPFVPKSGNTKCLFNCKCHLEFYPMMPTAAPTPPGQGTVQALMAPGKNVLVFDTAGKPIVGGIQKTLDDLYAQLYKARQMITASIGNVELRAQWIATRREINSAIIKAAGNYRAVPTISVGRLTDIIKTAIKRGGVVANMADVQIGNEVLFIRGDYSAMGVIQFVRNQLTFTAPSGIKLPINGETDVLFRFPVGGYYSEQLVEYGTSTSGFHGHAGRPGEVGGSADPGGEQKAFSFKNVDKIAKDTMNNILVSGKADGYEHSAVIKDGKIGMVVSGGYNTIKYTQEEIDGMKGSDIHVHYHPSSSAFSDDDIYFYIMHDIKCGVVVSDLYTYKIYSKDGWQNLKNGKGQYLFSPKSTPKDIGDAIGLRWIKYRNDSAGRYIKEYNSRSSMVRSWKDIYEIEKELWQKNTHEIMLMVAKDFGLVYTRTRRK